MQDKSYLIRVIGRVQGVNFRNKIKDFCDMRKIKGEIENKPDGSVLMVVSLSLDNFRGLLAYIKSGPGMSRVRKVDISEIDYKPFRDFRVLREGIVRDQTKSFFNLFRGLFTYEK